MDLGKLRALVDEIRERARIGETVGQEAGSSVAGCVVSGAGIVWEDAAKRLAAVLDEMEREQRWIPVSERLPEDGQTVLFVVAPGTFLSGRVYGGRYRTGIGGGFSLPGIGGIEATHWMPTPAAPKEGS